MDPTKVARPDLSAKLERLKKGLVADTVRLGDRRYPSLRYSRINYGLKSGRLGAFDPLRRRSKMFRTAVSRFAPPYYFWHKEYINSMKLKRMKSKSEKPVKKVVDDPNSEVVSCVWCQQTIIRIDYEFHRTKRCKRRHEFLTNGYYRCSSCDEAFLDEEKARNHVLLHFSAGKDGEDGDSQKGRKNVPIICRDHAKRRKWL